MIKCECGALFYSPKDARRLLDISGTTLNRLREDGWVQAEYHSVGYVYRQKDLEELQIEMDRRNKFVKTEVRYDGTS